jgi:hypothetical protein
MEIIPVFFLFPALTVYIEEPTFWHHAKIKCNVSWFNPAAWRSVYPKTKREMSKDKGNKSTKKAPNPDAHKAQSDYQASKTSGIKHELNPPTNKKK